MLAPMNLGSVTLPLGDVLSDFVGLELYEDQFCVVDTLA